MARTFSMYLLSALFILGGINHFLSPGFYRGIMPPWLPWHDPLIAISGVLEILGGALVLTRWRRFAGYFLILLLIAIFPANIYATVTYAPTAGNFLWTALLWLRLPLQAVLVWWVWRVCLFRDGRASDE